MAQSNDTHRQDKPPKLPEQVREVIRARHYGLRTEETYLNWMKRFILFPGKRHPREIGGQEVQQFLVLSGCGKPCRCLYAEPGVERYPVSVPGGISAPSTSFMRRISTPVLGKFTCRMR